jgi:hypothetical protein
MHRLIHRILRPFLVLLALVFLFEAWLWEHLAPIVGWIVARIPLREFKERAAAFIERLPPLATLLVFLIPVIVLLPIKVLGLWMLAHGSWLGAMATLGLAKVVSMGLTAFIFDLTRPKLLQLAWFSWFYDHILVWLARAHGLIDPIKRRVKNWLRVFSPKRAGRALRLLRRIRQRIQARVTA